MKRLGLVTEQLRRPTPGGIGRYVSCLRDALAATGEIELRELQGRLLWSAGMPTFASVDLLHATSFAFPRTLRPHPMTVFVHDLLWRSRDASGSLNARGAAFHDAGLTRSAQHADRILVPSTSVAEALALAGIAPERIIVTGEGCDHLPVKPRVTDAPPMLLGVSTFEPRKNLARLLAAFSRARNDLPLGTTLQIVGSDAWRGTAGLPNEIPPGVIVLGAVDDERLADLYAEATAFVYPSLGEGFGLPPLEALRAGVPVISSAVPSLTEAGQISPAEIVDPTDVDSIARGMIRVLTSETRRDELVRWGSDWTTSRTWAAVAEKHLAVWRSLW
jgi:glycosyltransferase involved in cell wall biosynthesis